MFKPPIDTNGEDGGYTRENQEMVQSRVSFDQGSDRAEPDDAFCTDGQKWYIYSDDRGLTRGNKKPQSGEWTCEKQDYEVKYEEFSMFCHQDLLLARHKGAED